MTAAVIQIQTKLMNKFYLRVLLLLLLSGDIELNPGPVEKQSTEQSFVTYSQAEQILHQRLFNIQLTALDVGGGGDSQGGYSQTFNTGGSMPVFLC